MKFNPRLMPLATFLCILLFFSCTSNIEPPPPPEELTTPPENPNPSSSAQTWDYCVYSQIQLCDPGPHSVCQGTGGELSNTCPYGNSSSSNSSSSHQGASTSSSSQGGSSSTSSSSGVANSLSFTDPRDGNRYKFEVAPNGKIWMSENLNYSKNGTGWCYKTGTNASTLGTAGEEGEGCNSPYGRVYEWATAIDGNSPQGLCPPGWHIPSATEWNSVVGTGKMSSSFYVLSGNYDKTDGWKDKGKYGFYWTSSANNSFAFFNGTTVESLKSTATATDKFYVRCVADDNFKLKCGTAEYNPATQKCSGTTVLSKCGTEWYNPSSQFCYNGSSVEVLCGGDEYNLAYAECISDVVTPKQGYAFCGNKIYDTERQKCVDGELIYLNYQMTCNNGTSGCNPERQVVKNGECIDLRTTNVWGTVKIRCACNINGGASGSITIQVGTSLPVTVSQSAYVANIVTLSSSNLQGGNLEVTNICVSFTGTLQSPATGVTCSLE